MTEIIGRARIIEHVADSFKVVVTEGESVVTHQATDVGSKCV
jgi:hypothetical protein